jgi:hypothetical protein
LSDEQLIYIHLPAGSTPPGIEPNPCRMVAVIEEDASDEWQEQFSDWVVDSGCLAFGAWGKKCEAFHDGVDWAILKRHNFSEIPDDQFIMTTWHDDEPLTEAFWFCRFAAFHPEMELPCAYIVHIAPAARKEELISMYWTELPEDEACQTPSAWHGLIKRLKFWGS